MGRPAFVRRFDLIHNRSKLHENQDDRSGIRQFLIRLIPAPKKTSPNKKGTAASTLDTLMPQIDLPSERKATQANRRTEMQRRVSSVPKIVRKLAIYGKDLRVFGCESEKKIEGKKYPL